jgi:hypothetical protein
LKTRREGAAISPMIFANEADLTRAVLSEVEREVTRPHQTLATTSSHFSV